MELPKDLEGAPAMDDGQLLGDCLDAIVEIGTIANDKLTSSVLLPPCSVEGIVVIRS